MELPADAVPHKIAVDVHACTVEQYTARDRSREGCHGAGRCLGLSLNLVSVLTALRDAGQDMPWW